MRNHWWVLGLSCAIACGGRSARNGAPNVIADASGGSAGNAGDPSASAGVESDPTGTSKAGRAGSADGSGGRGSAGAFALGGSANGETTSAGAAGEAGANAGEPCTPGTVRCNTVREHCDDSGVWVEESFVCATDITGSVEQALVCAVKSDGRMTVNSRNWSC